MAFNDPRHSIDATYTGARDEARVINQGLRAFMLAVYNHMTIGVALTALVSLGVFMLCVADANFSGQMTAANLTPLGKALFLTPLRFVVMFAPLAVVLWMSFGAQRLSASTATMLFYLYSALVGLSLSAILMVYQPASVLRVFAISAASFGALSLYGYTTKRNLSAFGAFMVMGLFGLLLASIVNMVWPSGTMTLAISVLGVGVFAGLTAWDTQKIKSMYLQGGYTQEEGQKMAIYGALELYLDFINLFIYLLRLLGDRR